MIESSLRRIESAFPVILATVFATFFLLSPASGQSVPSTEFDDLDDSGVSVKQVERSNRDRAFAQLAEEVQALERKGAILRRVAKLVAPSVVHIIADKRPPSHRPQSSLTPIPYDQFQPFDSKPEYEQPLELLEEAGSGTLVNIDNGIYVLTNRHVIRHTKNEGVAIQLHNGKIIHPKRRWADPSTDVAVLEVDAPHATTARLGNSDQQDIGDFVLAFGSPFGLSHSVTHGIISAKGRRDLTLGDETVHIQDFIQTDAAINPGNSGGPLLNLRGEVIGINTAIASNSGGNEGIAFSIPINLAIQVARELVRNGKLRRAYLGVKLENDYNAQKACELGMTCYHGAQVASVTHGSPADTAGLRPGDIIVSFEGVNVENDSHLVSMVGVEPVDAQVNMRVFRNLEPVEVAVQLRPRR
jgi:serine protease Do